MANTGCITIYECKQVNYKIDVFLNQQKALNIPNSGTYKPCKREVENILNQVMKMRPEYDKLNIFCSSCYGRDDILFFEFTCSPIDFSPELVKKTLQLVLKIIKENRI